MTTPAKGGASSAPANKQKSPPCPKGVSGNPRGRPKKTAEAREVEKAEATRAAAERIGIDLSALSVLGGAIGGIIYKWIGNDR